MLIALKKSADDKNNSLHLEFGEDIPKRVIGDPLKLSQILINLIGNAVKFTQNGKVIVRVFKLEEIDRKIKLHIEIEDDGVGFKVGAYEDNDSHHGLQNILFRAEVLNAECDLESTQGNGTFISIKIPTNGKE